jgi:hypothetical protein
MTPSFPAFMCGTIPPQTMAMSKLVLMISLATIDNLAAVDLSGKWT